LAEDLALVEDPRVLRSVERLGRISAFTIQWSEHKLRRRGEFDSAPLYAAVGTCRRKLEAGCKARVPESHPGNIASVEEVPKGVKLHPGLNKGVQTECITHSDAATGDSLVETVEVGVQTRDDLPESPEPKSRRRRRRRRRSGARTSAPASPSTNSSRGTGGGDMAAAGPPQVGVRKQQRSDRGVRATAPPRPAAGGPSFAAVAASAGRTRPPPCAVAAGGARGGGEDKVRAPADGGVSRGSLSGSPPPPRPEPKRKKGGPPPFDAAAKVVKGMRTQGSSIPAKDPWVDGRDVMADILSAVSLLAKCAAGVMSLESRPSRPRPRQSLSPRTYPGRRTGGSQAATTGMRAVRGRYTPRGRLDAPPPGRGEACRPAGRAAAIAQEFPPVKRRETSRDMLGVWCRGTPSPSLPPFRRLGRCRQRGVGSRGQGG